MRVRTWLESRGLLDAAGEERLRAELTARVDRAVQEAEAFAPAHPGQIFDHVYADPPARVRAQWAAVREG